MSLFSRSFFRLLKEAFWECAWERRHCEATGNLVIVTRSRTAEERPQESNRLGVSLYCHRFQIRWTAFIVPEVAHKKHALSVVAYSGAPERPKPQIRRQEQNRDNRRGGERNGHQDPQSARALDPSLAASAKSVLALDTSPCL